MSTTETAPTHDLAALQRLPVIDRPPDEDEDPGCATTGVTSPVTGPDPGTGPEQDDPAVDDHPAGHDRKAEPDPAEPTS